MLLWSHDEASSFWAVFCLFVCLIDFKLEKGTLIRVEGNNEWLQIPVWSSTSNEDKFEDLIFKATSNFSQTRLTLRGLCTRDAKPVWFKMLLKSKGASSKY